MGRKPGGSEIKRASILKAATEAFLSAGYGGTSMDIVAERAGVSKRTVYNHFLNKEALFGAVVERLWGRLGQTPAGEGTRADEDPAQGLAGFAERTLSLLLDPTVLALLRVVIAESPRFPEMSRAFYHHGKAPAVARLSAWIGAQAARGRLTVEVPELAAQQFLGMVKEALFWPRVLGVDATRSEKERRAVVQAAVKAFLRVYATP